MLLANHKALLLSVLANLLSEVGPNYLDSKTRSTWLLEAHFLLLEPEKLVFFRGPLNFHMSIVVFFTCEFFLK